MTTDTPLPPAPPEEENKDACCPTCGSLFHSGATHQAQNGIAALVGLSRENVLTQADEFPPGYDPAEADRLIGRDPSGPKPQ